MLLFLGGILVLIVGYFTYGRFIERVIGPDIRDTPATTHHDGVDYIRLPLWKNMLIQLLNIAGVGPVIGVILGIKFGAIAFLIIPVGNIIGGAVHDFASGMMSIRHRGANLPALIKITLGSKYSHFFSWFTIFLLLLVVAVFINIPASLLSGFAPGMPLFWYMVAAIFIYYIVATIFPVDKIIGMIYPFFGAMLLIGTFAIFIALIRGGFENPALFIESEAFKVNMTKAPVLPVLFVTIACGIISGFHATQSPIIARTIESEHHGLHVFYGMMVMEGIIGMVWAAAGMAIYNLFPEYMLKSPTFVLNVITKHFLGNWMGVVTIFGVIILAVTSGDTAMRSLRLTLAEMFSIEQRSLTKRILVCLPLIALVSGLLWWSNTSAKSFSQLWNYFAWGNQVMATSTLFAATVWLLSLRKNWIVTIIPAMFMTFIVGTYILWVSPKNGGPVGMGLPLHLSYAISISAAVIIATIVYRRGVSLRGNAHEQALVADDEPLPKEEPVS